MSAEEHLALLWQKVDLFFERVFAKHRQSMDCGSGCHDCCHVRPTITAVEATAVVRFLAELGAEESREIADAARSSSPARCAALDESGRCRIYPARPLVCRSHGVAIRRRENSLPVIDRCEHNFKEAGELNELDEGDILDQATLSTMLAAIEAAFSDEYGIPRGVRIDVAELLAEPGRFFDL